eukprot:8025348-Alexandrium_andersonii.AAC.1
MGAAGSHERGRPPRGKRQERPAERPPGTKPGEAEAEQTSAPKAPRCASKRHERVGTPGAGGG